MSDCYKNGKPLPAADYRDTPPHNNPEYAFSCSVPCYEPECKDIRYGEHEFLGESLVFGVCNLTKSYLIVKIEGDCEVNWNAVWMNGKTLIDTVGEYKIKYKWDACCELEPQFSAIPAPCPCK